MKEIEVVNAGYERVVNVLDDLIAEIENEKAEEIKIAVEPIEKKYAERLDNYKADRLNYVHTEQVEEDESAEDVVEDDVNAEETIIDNVPVDEQVECCTLQDA